MECKICGHEKREQIDQAVLNMSPGEYDEQLKQIAKKFQVPLPDLKVHVMSCKPVCIVDDQSKESLAKQIRFQEADMLGNVMCEYYETLTLIGGRIRGMAKSSEDASFARVITKPVVDLYLGAGNEIRKVAEALAEINTEVNGPKTDATSGLVALADAIKRSRVSQ